MLLWKKKTKLIKNEDYWNKLLIKKIINKIGYFNRNWDLINKNTFKIKNPL